jgi:hypothetical protein
MGNSEFDDVAAHLLEPEKAWTQNKLVSTWTKAIHPRKARENWGTGG